MESEHSYLSEKAEEDVGGERALVRFVHDDARVVVEVGLSQRLTQ